MRPTLEAEALAHVARGLAVWPLFDGSRPDIPSKAPVCLGKDGPSRVASALARPSKRQVARWFDRHALLEAAADRVPLWNFARSRAATRTRASGLVTRIVASPAAWAITISWVCRCMVTSGTTARR